MKKRYEIYGCLPDISGMVYVNTWLEYLKAIDENITLEAYQRNITLDENTTVPSIWDL
jgi:hypothetical protein